MLQTASTRNDGFTLIELSMVLVIIGLVMGGFLNLITISMANRQTADLNAAVESAKISAVLLAINNKEVTLVCVAGPPGCIATGCAGSTPCASFSNKYNIPSEVAVSNDPWGNPLIYSQQQPSVMASTAPDAEIFTVVSSGPDGVANTGDDFTRIVNANQFLALIAKTGLGG